MIGHRGACGYLPENTLASFAMAVAMGADAVECDVVLTKDDQLVVLHDLHLENVTDVQRIFSGRFRSDAHFRVIDFLLEDIQRLAVNERTVDGSGKALFSNRFPVGASFFHVPTLSQVIELIWGLNQSMGKKVTLFVEIKAPAWHEKNGKGIISAVIDTLDDHLKQARLPDAAILSFDPDCLKRIRRQCRFDIPLIQLIGAPGWPDVTDECEHLKTKQGLKQITAYAHAIGPWLNHIAVEDKGTGALKTTSLVENAHKAGLEVYPFTFRADTPAVYAPRIQDLFELFIDDIGVDGVITDFPDLAVDYLKSR